VLRLRRSPAVDGGVDDDCLNRVGKELSMDWGIAVPGASRSTIETLLLFAKRHRLGVIGSGMSSRSCYPRVFLADTYRLMARLLSATLKHRAGDLLEMDRLGWEWKIEDMFELCDEVRDTTSPLQGDFDLSLGFAPVLSAPATEFDWSASIPGLDEDAAGRIVRYAESLGVRAWAWNPEQVLDLCAFPASCVAQRLEWLDTGRALLADELTSREEMILAALFDDMRFWLETAPEDTDMFTVPFKDWVETDRVARGGEPIDG
jgi:hypothetical protein